MTNRISELLKWKMLTLWPPEPLLTLKSYKSKTSKPLSLFFQVWNFLLVHTILLSQPHTWPLLQRSHLQEVNPVLDNSLLIVHLSFTALLSAVFILDFQCYSCNYCFHPERKQLFLCILILSWLCFPRGLSSVLSPV